MRKRWKIVDKNTRYAVSTDGEVMRIAADPRSRRKYRPGFKLRWKRTTQGRAQVKLRSDGSHVFEQVHRLVAKAFIPNPLGLPEVNHLDGDPLNNRACNLEWTDTEGNMAHAAANGLMCGGENWHRTHRNRRGGRRLGA